MANLVATVIVLAVALASGSAEARSLQASYASVADFVVKQDNLKTVLAAASATGLVPALSDPNLTATVFLPTDAAFGKALQELNISAAALLANPDLVKQILTYHLYPSQVLTLSAVKALGGGPNKASQTVMTMMSGVKATLVKKAAKPAHLSLVDALGRKTAVSGYTKPGPFAAGKSIVWLIDNVLLPGALPSAPSPAPVPAVNKSSPSPAPVPAKPTSAPLLNFLKAQNLTALSNILVGVFDEATLSGLGNITILAPTDAAFGVLLAAAEKMGMAIDLNYLPAATKTLLQGVVGTHVIPAPVLSTDLKDGMNATTLSKAVVIVDLKSKPGSVLFKAPGGVPTNTSAVVKADIRGPNGIIVHTIDGVLSNIDLSAVLG